MPHQRMLYNPINKSENEYNNIRIATTAGQVENIIHRAFIFFEFERQHMLRGEKI